MAKKSKTLAASDLLHYDPQFDFRRFAQLFALITVFTLVFAAVVSRAWIAEDGFISFRVIDNLLDGYGLRWNIDERVQVFTHPLWLFVQIPFYLMAGDPFPTILISSLLCISILLCMMIVRYHQRPWVLLFCFAVPYSLSLPLLEFSTSGLENPLTFLLLTVFFFGITRPKADITMLSFCGALIGLNRLDTLIFVLPSLLLLWLRSPTGGSALKVLKGMLPFFLWNLFSFIYYGFMLPNTYYAKLHTGVKTMDYIAQGYIYVQGIFHHDPISTLIILAPLPILYFMMSRVLKQSRASKHGNSWKEDLCFFLCKCIAHKDANLIAWSVSIVGYIFYVVYVGGDFMAGRFFTPVLIASLLLLTEVVANLPMKKRKEWARPYLFGLALLVLVRGVTIGYWDRYDWKSGVINEWIYYHDYCWLWNDKGRIPSDYDWAKWALRDSMKAKLMPSNEYLVLQFNNVGLYGYFSHKQVVVVDGHALTDPLLARLPIRRIHEWRIGHFMRVIPDGYLYAREKGDTSRMQKDLAEYYKALRTITAGHLLSAERIKTMYLWYWGYYDHYRDAYIKAADIGV
ncbi:MAG: hypothetical protein EB060_02350 [Proteobacteria bacterium]|nr:hypothetical protein [Pseudomonadota bacterium]